MRVSCHGGGLCLLVWNYYIWIYHIIKCMWVKTQWTIYQSPLKKKIHLLLHIYLFGLFHLLRCVFSVATNDLSYSKERWNNMFTTGRHFYLSSPATSLVQVQGWICFCHRNCSNSFWHKFKVLETTDVCMYWHDSILQLLHIFWLHIHDGNFWSPQTELRSEDSGGYLITVDSFLCSRNQF